MQDTGSDGALRRKLLADPRWREAACGLAGNAAQFAFRLSQTSASERPRPADIQGEEAVFLDLACQRRGAQTVEDIDKALQSLRDYQTQIRATNPRLAAARLGVERISMGLTRLFLDFFRTGELDDSVRAQANSLLREALVQLNETQVSVQVDEAHRPAAVADVIDRLTVNICNLAWLTVGWSPLELGRSRSVGSKQSTFARHQEAATSEQVYSSLRTLKSNCYPPVTGHRERTYFDWLSLVICALHLEPDLLNWRDESARAEVVQSLTRLQGQEVDHPYDTKRLAYALDLASKLRFP